MKGEVMSRPLKELRDALAEIKEQYSHRRLYDDDWFDEINMRTVPRYKTSGLSGNEWRQGVDIDIIRKGHVLYTKRVRDLETAAAWLSWGLIIVREEEDISFPENEKFCSQPSCCELANVVYKIKTIMSLALE